MPALWWGVVETRLTGAHSNEHVLNPMMSLRRHFVLERRAK